AGADDRPWAGPRRAPARPASSPRRRRCSRPPPGPSRWSRRPPPPESPPPEGCRDRRSSAGDVRTWSKRTTPPRQPDRAASARRSAGVVEAGPGSARGLPARVDLLDDRCEVLDDHVALQLQRRREVAVLLGEVRVDDLEGTDRLGPGDGPVGAV